MPLTEGTSCSRVSCTPGTGRGKPLPRARWPRVTFLSLCVWNGRDNGAWNFLACLLLNPGTLPTASETLFFFRVLKSLVKETAAFAWGGCVTSVLFHVEVLEGVFAQR